jgi:hypothetical protein
MLTRTVYWKGKFNGDAVIINAVDFDPAIHSDTPWKAEKPAPDAAQQLADRVEKEVAGAESLKRGAKGKK